MAYNKFVNKQEVDKLVDELARAISDERCFMSRGRSTSEIMQDILDLPPIIVKEENSMIRNYLVIARVSINFDGWYGATEDYILGHSQSKMIADSYAAALNRELELYKEGKEDEEIFIFTDYRFLWEKEIIDDPIYEYYKNADEISVSFVVVETENIDTDLSNVEVCKEVENSERTSEG